MKSLNDSLFLKACRLEKTERTPIWLMRQAGRYMKEYRAIRAEHDFLSLCKNPDLCAEITVHAAHVLDVDAAIIFSDLLLLVEPLGFQLSYGKDQGPAIANPFRTADDLKRVKSVNASASMSYVMEAIKKTRQSLKDNIPLIGFAGAPFTMASYMIEGRGSKTFAETKRLMAEDPATWNALLTKITDATIDYLNLQLASGAQAIQIFDSWVGCLSPDEYEKLVLPHVQRLIKGLSSGSPIIYFGTQTKHLLLLMKQSGASVMGVDWRIELDQAWKEIGADKALMGNLDPNLLLSTPEAITAQAQKILRQANGQLGHIFNLGHGILPATPVDNVLHLIKTVKQLSQRN